MRPDQKHTVSPRSIGALTLSELGPMTADFQNCRLIYRESRMETNHDFVTRLPATASHTLRVTVHWGTPVWLRRRSIHPVKPACVLGPAYSGPSDPPYCHWKVATSWTRVHFVLQLSNDNRQVRQVPSSPALRARSVLRANWPPTCLRPERLPLRWISLSAFVLAVLFGCGNKSDNQPIAGTSGGGTALGTGGDSQSGASGSGGALTGGAGAGGAVAGTGGASGDSSGGATGGVETGGMETGGMETGGMETGGADAGGADAGGTTTATGPCDIYESGNTPCVAAHSTVRSLYGAYSGSLYQVRRTSDGALMDIGVLGPGGFADSAAQDGFCAGTTCTILHTPGEK
jgi:hypothetical protein